jgi:hypothetical protein
LKFGKQVDNQVVDPKADYAKPEADHAELEADLAGKEGQKGKKGDNKKKRDAEPSTITLVVKEPPRSFVPKAPYPERLQAPKKGGKK